ncbi:MAG TPA: ATP-binding cassette domain-containing protein [Thermoanaerobaculia bacterium]|nr:ATP-binding cassette domain-containing protein [Thermoanaerobaculia bacterium]
MRFGATTALSEVSIDFRPGEIHAVLGENGAGKSTLANVLDGRIVPDSGEVSVPGTVGHVHQHFAIPPGLTAAECLAVEDSGFRPLAPRPLARRFRRIEEETGIALGNPGAEAARLPVGARQRLELARALFRRPDLLLLDEPTAVLAPAEIAAFAESVRGAARRGAAVVFITHKLPEAFAISDRITLLRRGRCVFTKARESTSPEEIARLFLEGAEPSPRTRREPGPPVLVVEGVSTTSSAGATALDDLSLVVREGEIAAVVGVDGNGQDELAEVVAGLRDPASGSVRVGGEAVGRGGFRRSGASVVPGDRQREGLILDFSIADNLRLAEPIPDADEDAAERAVAATHIVASSSRQRARALSGGNQQKTILARELGREPAFLLAVSPTRGLDLAASRATLAALSAAAARGGSVLLVTSDLDDARSVADTIRVLYRGRLSAALPADTPLESIGRAMIGLPPA